MTSVVFYYNIDDDPILYRGKYKSCFIYENQLETLVQDCLRIGLDHSRQEWELPPIQSIQIGPLLHVEYQSTSDPQEKVWYDFYGIEDETRAFAYVQRNSSKL